MPLDLVITPIAAPTLANLSAVATLKGILLKWDALKDASLFATEVWVSETDDRSTATLLQTCTSNSYLHTGLPSAETRYYWIRSKNIYERADGAWTPVSSTAGVSATTLLTQTADIGANAITSVTLVQSSANLVQTNYSTWEQVYLFTFLGTGNMFVVDAQHLSDLALTSIGTTGDALAYQKLEIIEHTGYTVGTISMTNASTVVTGIGTSWVGNVVVGDVLQAPNGGRYLIAAVNSDTQLTLSLAYQGASVAAQAYFVITNGLSGITQGLTFKVAEYEMRGGQLLSNKTPFSYRLPMPTTFGKLYDCRMSWYLYRSDASWAISQSSVLKTIILEEIKR